MEQATIPRRHRVLYQALGLMAAISFLPLLVVGGAAISLLEREARQDAEAELLDSLAVTGQEIDYYLASLTRDIAFIARHLHQEDIGGQENRQFIAAFASTHGDIMAIWANEESGPLHTLYYRNRMLETAMPAAALAALSLPGNASRPAFSEIGYNAHGEPMCYLRVIVRKPWQLNATGSLLVEMRLTRIKELLAQAGGRRYGGAFLTDRVLNPVTNRGAVQAFRDNHPELRQLMAGGSHEARIHRHLHPGAAKEAFLTAYLKLPEIDWLLGIERREREVYETRDMLLLVLAGGFLLLLFLLFPLTLFLSYRFTRPTYQLIEAARGFAAGRLDARLRHIPTGELGILARTFNRMADLRQESEESLAEERDRLAVTLRSIGDAVIATDAESRITLMNPMAETFTGWSQHEASGRNLEECFHIVNESTGELCENPAAKVIKTGQVVGLANHTALIARDGTVRSIADSGAPIRDQTGRTIGVILVFRDITEERRGAEALRESEEKYREVVEGTADLIICLDRDWHLTFINSVGEEVLGCRAAGCQGRSFLDFVHPDDRERTSGILAGWRQRQGGGTIENRLVSEGSGALHEISWRVNLHHDQNGALYSCTAIGRDVTALRQGETERAQLEAQLRHAQKMEAIGTLAGGIAHDFNNILTAVLVYARLAKDEMEPETPQAGYLQEVVRASNRARDLVKQILAFSRRSEGHLLQPLALPLLVEETLKLLRPTLPATIDIRTRITPDCGTVLADPTQIHQLLMNLCTNAYNAMRTQGGILEIALDRVVALPEEGGNGGGPHLRLMIRDTGHGMDPGTAERIFEPYFTTRERGEGTGMGLYIVHGIVKNHKGCISVASEPGKGTTIHVYLPCIDAESMPESGLGEELLPCSGHERLLVVDDQGPVLAAIMAMLTRCGYQVTGSPDSRGALALFRDRPEDFDLVLTDMTMPGITGDQLFLKMRSIRPDIPVILMTGFSELIDQERAAGLGIDCLIIKPITASVLTRAIRQVLERQATSG